MPVGRLKDSRLRYGKKLFLSQFLFPWRTDIFGIT